MKCALVNPNWTFEGSVYFGCRDPHLPLEYGYAKALLEREGHHAVIVDGHLDGLSNEDIRRRVSCLDPDYIVVTTAPSYLFWRCPPPELCIPSDLIRVLNLLGAQIVGVGPHVSSTPESTLEKLGANLLILGEFEEVLPHIVGGGADSWSHITSLYSKELDHDRSDKRIPHFSNMKELPALQWPRETLLRHTHHHHRFDREPFGPGAEMETSRGCPYNCSFCAKTNFRNRYRKRPISTVVDELDSLIACGVEYVYFVDEIFLPDKNILSVLMERKIEFGVQTRLDLWDYGMLEYLGDAGCVSIEAGVESISEGGRDLVNKKCRLSFAELTDRLVFARRHVPFVQANLLKTEHDDTADIEAWREYLLQHGVWANKPVPLFPYPGSPIYEKLWGPPDNFAWERAHDYYLRVNSEFSDIQNQQPLCLSELERRSSL